MRERYYIDNQGQELHSIESIDQTTGMVDVREGIEFSQASSKDREYTVAFGLFYTIGKINCTYDEATGTYSSVYIDQKTAKKTPISTKTDNQAGFTDVDLARTLDDAIDVPFEIIMVEYHNWDFDRHEYCHRKLAKIEERFYHFWHDFHK